MRLRRLFPALIRRAAAVLLPGFAVPEAGFTVWAATGTVRYKRDAAAGSGTAVALRMAGHERRSFQILARAAGQVTGLNLVAGDLTDADGNTIAASDITIERAHQLNVTTATTQNAAAIAAGETLEGTGWYADALIPTKHPVSGTTIAAGHTYQAQPYTLPADQTHTFLVTIYVPRGTAAGDYTGTVTVSADGQDDVVVTISLHVWGWALPYTPALRTALWAGTTDALYGHKTTMYANGWTEGDFSTSVWEDTVAVNVDTVLSRLGIAAQPFHVEIPLDFRPEPDDTVGPYEVSSAHIAALRTHIDTYFPSAIYLQHPHIYEGPFADPTTEPVDDWATAYAAGIAALNRSDVTAAIFLKDEPYSLEQTDYVNLWGPPLLAGGVHVMVTHAIATPIPGNTGESMIGSADIWTAPVVWYDHAFDIGGVTDTHVNTAVAARLAALEEVWLYTALSGNSDTGIRPYWHLDRPLLNYRVLAWLAAKAGMTGILYWAAGVDWWDVYAETPPDNDPWTNPATETTPSKTYNSEGLLFYPADTTSIGFYGIVPSLRAVALRDGIQDFGYFAVAESVGIGGTADALIAALVRDFSDWTNDPAAYDTARETLGDAIEAAINAAGPYRVAHRYAHFAGAKTRHVHVAGARWQTVFIAGAANLEGVV